jgi:hypothetical protein
VHERIAAEADTETIIDAASIVFAPTRSISAPATKFAARDATPDVASARPAVPSEIPRTLWR